MAGRSLFATRRSAGEAVDLALTGSVTFTLVWCPAGTFVMGDPDVEPGVVDSTISHHVNLTHGFWIGKTPVTQQAWESVMGSRFRASDSDDALVPVDGVSWKTAMAFCERVSELLQQRDILQSEEHLSLPTEAQWEYACRAGTETRWYFGDDPADLSEHAWYRLNSGGVPHAVALKAANPWGVHDLYGNVAEWCLDSFSIYTSSAANASTSISEDSELKIVRGGSYRQLAEDCRSASRQPILQDNPFVEETGLRVVCVSEQVDISLP